MPRAPWQERVFRILLRLFPSEFRGDFGEQMAQDFRDGRQEARGHLATSRLWASTAAGILRQAPREHLDILARDLRHAIRLLRARGWRAGLAVGLLGIAIAANALLFAAADSLIFARVPYPSARELVELQRIDPANLRKNCCECPNPEGAVGGSSDGVHHSSSSSNASGCPVCRVMV